MSNDKALMTSEVQSTNAKRKFDLEERTAKFGEQVIDFVKTLEQNPINKPLVSQIVRSATSIGVNYMEADVAGTKKDFKHKISLCRKEAKETLHWLRMVAKANPTKKDNCKVLWKEAKELTLIFSAIFNSSS